MAEELKIYTVYDHPDDYPDGFVLVMYVIKGDGEKYRTPLLYHDNYEDIKEEMEMRGLMRLDRDPDDDPSIKETWI